MKKLIVPILLILVLVIATSCDEKMSEKTSFQFKERHSILNSIRQLAKSRLLQKSLQSPSTMMHQTYIG